MSTIAPNGYTIRLELLKMAKEMLEQDWHAQRDAVMTDYHTKASRDETFIPATPTFAPFPTEEQIIKKAKVLNEFINTK
jgi:hypothetical protein